MFREWIVGKLEWNRSGLQVHLGQFEGNLGVVWGYVGGVLGVC